MKAGFARKQVLVTGAFGGIGSEILQNLIAKGHEVTCLDLKNAKTKRAATEFIGSVKILWGSITDAVLLEEALKDIDVVIHMAAIVAPAANKQQALATQVNVVATETLINLMTRSKRSSRLIFASSVAVAGKQQHLRSPPLVSTEPPAPDDHYGATKAECERCIIGSNLRWSILRIGACPHANVIGGGKDGLQMIFDTSAAGRVEFVHFKDVGLAFSNTVDCDETIHRILLIGGGINCRTHASSLYDSIFTAMGIGKLPHEAFYPGSPRFFGDWLDTQESNALLQYQHHSLDDFYRWLSKRYAPVRLLLKFASPIVRKFMAGQSPHYSLRASKDVNSHRLEP